jgi:hypothetical protein
MQVLHASIIAKSGFSKRSAVEPDSCEPLIHVITHVCYIHRIAICSRTDRTFNSETMNGDNLATTANSSVRSFSGLTGDDTVDFSVFGDWICSRDPGLLVLERVVLINEYT